MRTTGGLHPSYIGFNQSIDGNEMEQTLTHSELVEAALQDVFDVITLQDRLDGGISLIIRCAGGKATPNISPEQIPIDIYITPHELQETPQRIGEDVTVLVQAFVQEFAVPHLKCFAVRCIVKNMKPSRNSHISINGPQHLPAPMVATGTRIQCSVQAPKVFFTTDMFAKSSPLVVTHTESNATLDQLNLGDKNVLKLQTLIGTICSSHWEAILRSLAWDLKYEKAAILSSALLADLQVDIWSINPEVATSLKVSTNHHGLPPSSSFSAFSYCLSTASLVANDYPVLLFSETQFKHKACSATLFVNVPSRGPIRSKHSKLNLWNTFCWKKNKDKENYSLGTAALQSLVHDNKDEYFTLSKEEQDKLLTEFVEFKETKTIGVCTSMKSKINDITHTLKAVENEFTLSYRCRDYPLHGIAFATEGIENFMGTVMGVDNQDLVSKIEGFAVQGMKEEITGDNCAKMQWVYYFHNVIQHYQVVVEGWPEKIPFTNLSQVSSTLLDLQMLLHKWESGAMYWKSLSDEEFEELCKECKEKLKSDKGKKHTETIGDDNSDAEGDEVIREPAAPFDKAVQESAAPSDEAIRESAVPSDEAIHESAVPSVVATASASPDTTSPQPLDRNFSASGSFDQYISLNTLDCNAILANLERLFGPAPSTLLE
ncbi:uncharacterized protein F5147DRAFT_650807 [Suillus discolor]|uniref:Uncharacterized protein n=1 Tax=Suillus discolor TaxID=1912936 RepID=A0A9P7JWK4_9AGAM|nr:uncharacterized protein F5147DRAFT_650807 [Suillus discolor]KAG2112651.1 hypothetical protein F5147DRAFT_650807 [Suillus discolor]